MKKVIKSADELSTRKGLSNSQYDQLEGIISWNGYYYAYRRLKRGTKYYKSKTARFDDSMGGVEEISSDEYQEYADKYAKVMRW